MISDAIAVVRDIVAALGQNMPIQGVISIEGGYRIIVADTLWVKAGDYMYYVVDEERVPHLVLAVDCKGAIDLAWDEEDAAPEGVINTEIVHFTHGTVRKVQNDLMEIQIGENDITHSSEISPLVYYVEATRSNLEFDETKQVDSRNDARLIVMGLCSDGDWNTAAHYSNVIEPCENIVKELIEAFKDSPLLGRLTTGSVENRVNVGAYSDKGTERNLFNYFFSGVDFRLTLPLKTKGCEC